MKRMCTLGIKEKSVKVISVEALISKCTDLDFTFQTYLCFLPPKHPAHRMKGIRKHLAT